MEKPEDRAAATGHIQRTTPPEREVDPVRDAQEVAGDDAGKTAAKKRQNGGVDMIYKYGAKSRTPKQPPNEWCVYMSGAMETTLIIWGKYRNDG